MTPAWEARLAELLSGGDDLESGAELEVHDLAGKVVFLAPLARHYRIEDDALWIRPVVGGYEPERAVGAPVYAFSLNEARARGLSPLENIAVVGEELVVRTGAGQEAHIRRAGPTTMPELERWDAFFYNVLSAQEQLELDEVVGDSYWGEWA
ncbi:MAG TPA: hypothetical protein VGV93_13035 [Acidimicrobiales bacterium]|nr:hypothetical protein [Acidimicrobiales bacterium]